MRRTITLRDRLHLTLNRLETDMKKHARTIPLSQKIVQIIAGAEKDGLTIDDGNVIDLLYDNTSGVDLNDLRKALSTAGLAQRFPKASHIRTLKESQAECRSIGVVLTKQDEEYRVNFKGGKENTASYTNDLDDAVGTARAMGCSSPTTRSKVMRTTDKVTQNTRWSWTVTGSGAFPFDMLRRDQCYPDLSDDVAGLDQEGFTENERTLTLRSAAGEPDKQRWESFGWKVAAVRRNNI